MAETKVSMKLLINSQTNKVLFAEAGKDCVDYFLFYIMSLPIATVTTLLREQGMVGSLSNLHESLENMDGLYIQDGLTKSGLLKVIATPPSFGYVPLLRLVDTPSNEKIHYVCSNFYYCKYKGYSDDNSAICRCGKSISQAMTYIAPSGVEKDASSGEGGFVKGVVAYMITGDLVVEPMSAISSLTLIKKHKVKDVGALKEKVVSIGIEQAVKLLKASLQSKEVLTQVFLN